MKNTLNIFVLFFAFLIVISCEKGEVFTGSPIDSALVIEPIVGTVTINETTVVDGQKIPITVTLPKAFDENVNIQATTFVPSTNKRITTSFIMPAGQTSINTLISGAPSDSSDLKFIIEAQVFLTALGTDPLKPTVGFNGKQYSLSSNIAKVDYGDTAIPPLSSSRCYIRFDYEYPQFGSSTFFNNLNIVLKKNNGTIVQPITSSTIAAGFTGTSTTSGSASRYENVILLAAAPADTYTLSIYAVTLINSPSNLNYRFAVRFPNQDAKTYAGVLNNFTVLPLSGAIAKLQVNKSADGIYTVSQI